MEDIKKRIRSTSKEGQKHAGRGRYDKAFECYRQALTDAEHLGIDRVLRSCAFNIGALCVLKRGDYEAGVGYLQKAINPDSEDQDGAEVFNLMANGYEKQGNLDKAYENYCKVRKIFRNLRSSAKEIEALENMVRISNNQNNSQQALDHINDLIRVCDVLGDREGDDDASQAQLKRLKWMVEKGHVLFSKEKKERKKALEIANDCFEELLKMQKVRDADITTVFGIFNELGLLLTHLKQLESAVQCFYRVVELIPNLSRPQLGIIKQNLGAVYNFMEKYEEAIIYHKEAADLHASPHSRASQGHCYCNKAFAHFQLYELQNANISFHLALEAAKEAGDLKTQWQALEGLGTVALAEHNFPEAVDFFRQAFTCANRTPDKEAQDRLMRHLQGALSMDSVGPPSVAGPPSIGGRSTPLRTMGGTGTMRTFIRHPTQNSARMEALASGRAMSRAGVDPTRAIASNEKFLMKERKNGKTVQTVAEKRVLKVRRSGSLRKFEKVALGIQASQTMGNVDEDDEETDSSEESTDDDAETDSNESAGIPHAGDTVLQDEEEDKAAVRENMKQCLSEEDEDENEEDEETEDEETEEEEEEEETSPKRPVSAQIHQQPRPPRQEETKKDKDEESSTSSVTSSSDEETAREKKTSEKPSAGNTYENPVPIGSGTSTGNYAEIDFDKTSELRKADSIGATGDSTIYETIKPSTSQGRDSPDNETTSADNPGNLSRAQREKMMYEYHLQREETLTAERNGDAKEDDTKKPKTCILM